MAEAKSLGTNIMDRFHVFAAAAAGALLGMIDGSFPWYRGKYLKLLYYSHLQPHTSLCVSYFSRDT